MFLLRQLWCPNISQDVEKKQDYIVLKPGTLHNTQALQPTADIWLKSKQAWFVPPNETAHFEGPPDFKELLKV